jgi:hypothetical protein
VGTRGARDDGPNGYEPRRSANGPQRPDDETMRGTGGSRRAEGPPRNAHGNPRHPDEPQNPPQNPPQNMPPNGPQYRPQNAPQYGPGGPRSGPPYGAQSRPQYGPRNPPRGLPQNMSPNMSPNMSQGLPPGVPPGTPPSMPPGGPQQRQPSGPDPRNPDPRNPDFRGSDFHGPDSRGPEPRSRRREEPPEPEPGSRPHSRRREPEPEEKPRKSGRGATFSVLMMTGASLLVIGVLAAQASGAPRLSSASASSSSGQGATGTATISPSSGATSPAKVVNPLALPADSGSGTRIVYSVEAKRVWLVGADGTSVEQTFPIVPGTVPVPAGTYHVSNRASGETGTDGLSVQYVVFFDNAATVDSSTAFAFDAEADVTGLPPAPTGKTGAVRMAQTSAGEIWYFAPIGTLVVVI